MTNPAPRSRRHLSEILGRVAIAGALVGPALLIATLSSRVASASTKSGVISAVGAENEYANVLSQVGGKYVSVSSVLNNPTPIPTPTRRVPAWPKR